MRDRLDVEVEACPRCGHTAAVTYAHRVDEPSDAIPAVVRCSNPDCEYAIAAVA